MNHKDRILECFASGKPLKDLFPLGKVYRTQCCTCYYRLTDFQVYEDLGRGMVISLKGDVIAPRVYRGSVVHEEMVVS